MLTKISMKMSGKPSSKFRPVHRRQSPGFTLIELVIVMVIVAIGVALAVPTFRDTIEKRQLTSSAEYIATFMSLSKSNAVKHNRDVIVNMRRTDLDTWCIGATLGSVACNCFETDPANTLFCDIEGVAQRLDQAAVISNASYELMFQMNLNDTATANGNFIFDPVRGTLVDLDTVNIQMHTNEGSGANKNYQLEVDILPTGRVSICTASGRKRLLRRYPEC